MGERFETGVELETRMIAQVMRRIPRSYLYLWGTLIFFATLLTGLQWYDGKISDEQALKRWLIASAVIIPALVLLVGLQERVAKKCHTLLVSLSVTGVFLALFLPGIIFLVQVTGLC